MLNLGQIILSPGAEVVLDEGESGEMLRRHSTGDYGNVSLSDEVVNDYIVDEKQGEGLVKSVYRSRKGFEITVVTSGGITKLSLTSEGQNVAAS